MSDTRRVPGQSVMQRLFRRESVRPMFGPNPAFFQRFGLADPYALGPAWDVDSGQDFFFTVNNYHSMEYILRLAQIITKCEGLGSNRLILQNSKGEKLPWSDEPVFINCREFSILAKHYGL